MVPGKRALRVGKWGNVLLGRVLFVLGLPCIRLVIRRTQRVYLCIESYNEYLVLKNWLARDTWRLPGGGKKRFESPTQAIVREAKEELGLDIPEQKLSCLGELVAHTDRLGFTYSVFTYAPGERPEIRLDGWENTTYAWLSYDDLNQTAELRDVARLLGKK